MAVSWMKTGADSAAIAKADEAEKALQKESQGHLWRFFLKDKEEARITFIDGDLDADGFLTPPRFYEHSIQLNGQWGHFFVCPEKTVPSAGHKCPICATGDRPALVGVFTIIDHREFVTKAGKKMGNQKRLFVAKPISMEMLAKIAVKRGGLAGGTFDVTRMGDKSAAIGSMFDFVEKNPIEKLASLFTEEVEVNGVKKTQTLFSPADYLKEIPFRTPAELLQAGVGSSQGNVLAPGGSSQSKNDYSKML